LVSPFGFLIFNECQCVVIENFVRSVWVYL
jgi:hypothetical protein